MDILKVLSRGIKQPPKSSKNDKNALTNLPSAGNRANPQFFHDDVGVSRGHKRKRREEAVEDGPVTQLPEVDFFAPKQETSDITTVEVKETPTPAKHLPTAVTAPTLLDDDECRRLLRSHRLKFTVLSHHEKKQSKVTKAKKKKKAVVAVKEEPSQIFPQPLTSFRELRTVYHISPQLAENLARESYKIPTECQMAILPLLLQPQLALGKSAETTELGDLEGGVDLLAVAPTGSGKTMSFLIPTVNAIIQRRGHDDEDDAHELQAIVVVPTRELAFQIVSEARKLALGTGVKIVGMRKGMRLPAEEEEDGAIEDSASNDSEEVGSEEEDVERDAHKPRSVTVADILVTTPMLLLNFLGAGRSNTHRVLPTVRSLILDEADALLDELFREQTLGIWSACSNPELRVSFWSATMGSNIETLIKDTLVSRSSTTAFIRLVVGLKDTAVPNITHKLVYTATEQGKLLALRQLLHPTSGEDSGPPLRPPFLVFVQTIDRATALHEELKYDIPLTAGGPSRIASLHSGLSDSDRAGIMRRFRAGEIWVLITTDVLSRGIDFAGVNGAVNYDVPGSSAAYVHRAGRTGRAGREGGVAVTFYTKDDIPFVRTVANVIAASERQAGKLAGDGGVQKWLLDALPKVAKADRKRLKERGVEARRTGGGAKITSKSGWERRREHNREGAIVGSKQRKAQGQQNDDEAGGDVGEWGGIDD